MPWRVRAARPPLEAAAQDPARYSPAHGLAMRAAVFRYVETIEHDGTEGYGEAAWNLISRNGQEVVSGIYLYVVQSNDGAFEDFIGRKVRDDRLVYLEPGKPLIFGKERNKGIMLDGFSPKVVTIGENGISESDLLVWDAHDPQDQFRAEGTPQELPALVQGRYRGLLDRITFPGDVTISYKRNDMGQPTEITDANGGAWRVGYDKQGRIISFAAPKLIGPARCRIAAWPSARRSTRRSSSPASR